VGGVDGLYGASSIAISPDEKHLYTSGRDDDAVAVFSQSIPSADLEIVKPAPLTL
jgi:6-phosphogluconolactonase (cycloisomerase 2 family)